MKVRYLSTLVFLSAFCIQTSAQFYAPDTEYHDPVQRVYVVEAARVLGWLSGLRGSNFTEVAYSVTTRPDGTTVWEVRWLDGEGKSGKTANISYGADDLKKGPTFYRSIFKQLWMAGWEGLSPLKPQDVRNEFWNGAARMGPSREESLLAAMEMLPAEKGPDWTWQPKLAGLLVHAALPGTSDRLALDWVILARSAAWLALVEQACASNLDDLWSPVLFQAGRERAAIELWTKSRNAKLEKATPQESGWNIWLRKPTSKEVYLFATESTNFFMAMPMLAYDVMVNQSGTLLADLMEDFAGSPRSLAAFHNYAPLFTRTSISGGHLLYGNWPVIGRAEWLKLLSRYRRSSHDYNGFTNALNETVKLLQQKQAADATHDPSLTGLHEIAPLLRLARNEGVGALTPTAVVTVRDILNYGWEVTGLQMGSRYRFVARRWGIPEAGEVIFKTVTDEVEGLMPFFKSSRNARTFNYGESLRRLQMIPGLFQLTGFSDHPFDTQTSPAENVRLFVKRLWLRPRDFEWQIRTLWDADASGDFPELVERWRTEGGALAAVQLLYYLDDLNAESMKKVPRGREFEYELAEALPQPTGLYVRSIYDRKLGGLSNLERAREVERLYWKNPDSGLEERVFRNYLVARAFKSARRFYTQARPNLIDPVGFSNDMGELAYVAGYLLSDREMQQMALEDSRSGSAADMTMHIWDAAARDNAKEVEQHAREMVDRYESNDPPNSRGRRLLKFLPLLPALRDAKHSDHVTALRFFGKDEDWLILRWIWIEKFKLSPEDAIVFLGGRETGMFQHVLICYLGKDAAAMGDALNKFNASRAFINEFNVLAMILYKRLHDPSGEIEDVDLKPPSAASVRDLVRAKLKR